MADFGFGLGLPLSAMLMASASPSILYANGEQGLWISPSDISTLYQDSLGTTPVTAFGQPVGLALDKSRAMPLGPELISGSWTLTTAGTATATESPAGTLNLTGDGTNSAVADISITTVIGATYKITASVSSTAVQLTVGVTQGGGTINNSTVQVGPTSFSFVATSTTTWIRFSKSSAFTSVVTTISARQVTHLGSERITNGTFTTDLSGWTQVNTGASTVTWSAGVALFNTNGIDAARLRQSFPTIVGETYLVSTGGTNMAYSIGTTAGGVDLASFVTVASRPTVTFVATSTTSWFNASAFTNGATLDNVSVHQIVKNGSEMNSILPWTLTPLGTSTATESPTGTLNLTGDGTNAAIADKSFSTVAGATYRVTFTSASSVTSVGVGATQGSTAIAAPANTLGAGSFYFLATGATSWLRFFKTPATLTTVSNISVKLVAGAHASQPTSTKRPTYVSTAGGPGLQFDGVDDFLQTPTITPGTDKGQIFAGLRKLSDAARGILVIPNGASSRLSLEAPNASLNNYAAGAGGSVIVGAASGTFSSPHTAVLTAVDDISAATLSLRVNGSAAGSSVSSQGTGNHVASTVTIGASTGGATPFNGILTELVMRFGATPSADRIAAMERYTNRKTVAY
jgi:hypothetical protein